MLQRRFAQTLGKCCIILQSFLAIVITTVSVGTLTIGVAIPIVPCSRPTPVEISVWGRAMVALARAVWWAVVPAVSPFTHVLTLERLNGWQAIVETGDFC